MKKYKEAFYSKKEVHVVTCNCCGKSIAKNEYGYFEDHATIEKTWGFGSDFDNQTHVVDICQQCYKKFFDQLVISPITDGDN